MKQQPGCELTKALISEGYLVVAGMDEVGRGCLAGPVTSAAVILAPKTVLTNVFDSKLMTPSGRQQAAKDIRQAALSIGMGWASSAEIDRYGLSWAVRQAGLRALANLQARFDAVILDGSHNFLLDDYYSIARPKADSTELSVAAASVIAKVARDQYMRLQHRRFPHYGFDRHKGYGTQLHLAALAGGLSPLHRRSFANLSALKQAYVD